MRVLFVGDIVGKPGVDYVREVLQRLASERKPDLVVANAENAADGRGLTRRIAETLYDSGVEIITMGNHTWDQKELASWIDEDERIVRPANFPDGVPGQGFTVCRVNGIQTLIVNLMGRTFLSQLDCPFRTLDHILEQFPDVRHVLVDMHAETTSEKLAIGWAYDGRVSAVLGTHTHVPTADERVLPGGTAYLTDVGMVGPVDGILGMDRNSVIYKMRTQMPARFTVAGGLRQFCAVQVDLDDQTGKAAAIERIFIRE
ncbi:TIGR00282 family metallophosphoesterase [Alicyclobacillus cycloheptanicus]|uniref:Metallophosphoesterase (TIGR00282 family) n=1 Tax=Alicyclobacillus cycloheptanicus TaxID=1457 RepID=A0ABT9XG77_9BACL|nr:TIGR00282 family metallophosphoesterase [Alicyclobacillus cycloheptanicus]MDQ0189299.1 metallophosphoesterase (TIGR00282 family) [Alicyclobacillus cycloheptanicus]WDM01337.1 TIGR00282 family metallophosphoesterase [Alicyclobacillus cycloheptanicus]